MIRFIKKSFYFICLVACMSEFILHAPAWMIGVMFLIFAFVFADEIRSDE